MTNTEKARVIARLKRSEGFRARPYLCPAGRLTIGYGHNLDAKPLTIAFMEAISRKHPEIMLRGLTEPEADKLLREDVDDAEGAMFAAWPWLRQAPDAVQGVVLDMAFNMGCKRLSGFRRMLAALQGRDYGRAADEMRASQWAIQVGGRADELIRVMRQGGEVVA